jgi:hypothetical protein
MNQKNPPYTILMIRGHIRDSFNNKQLYNLIKNINNNVSNLKIYIHTWHIFSNSLSWRQVNPNYTLVTENTIYEYFNDISYLISKIIIDDDSKIKLIGNLENKISGVTKLGWKNYWYGKFKLIDYIYNQKINQNSLIINLRFDVLTNSCPMKSNDILNLINNNKNTKFNKNVFLTPTFVVGIDNLYLGNINTMYKLISYFYYNLDNILKMIVEFRNQEQLVYIMNNYLFKN